jgi:hypothetical protein
MTIWDNKWFKLSIVKQVRFFKRKWYWKPLVQPHRKSMAEFRYTGNDNCSDLYTANFSFVTHFIQVFWLWFIVALELKEEKLSSSKYVTYESTHYAMIDEQLPHSD